MSLFLNQYLTFLLLLDAGREGSVCVCVCLCIVHFSLGWISSVNLSYLEESGKEEEGKKGGGAIF